MNMRDTPARATHEDDYVGPLWALGAVCVLALLALMVWISAELMLLVVGR